MVFKNVGPYHDGAGRRCLFRCNTDIRRAAACVTNIVHIDVDVSWYGKAVVYGSSIGGRAGACGQTVNLYSGCSTNTVKIESAGVTLGAVVEKVVGTNIVRSDEGVDSGFGS